MSTARRPIKARQTKWAERMAAALAARGVRPNTISVASVFFACAAALALGSSIAVSGYAKTPFFILAICFIQGRLLCNLFDGMVAVEGGFKTRAGAVFNDLPDRIADPVILIAVGYAACGIATATVLGWLAGLLAVLTAYIRFLGVAAGAPERFTGPMAKQHRMAVCTAALAGAALFPGYHGPILATALGIICAGCVITAVRRTRAIIRELAAE